MSEKTRILRPAIFKTVLHLLGSLAFVAIGFYTLEEDPLISWMGILFFGLGVVVFSIQLFTNASYLKLTEEGFEVRNLYRREFTKWNEIASINVGYVGQAKMVVFDYTDAHQKQERGKKIARFLAGHEGALPNNYGIKTEELAALMRKWKMREFAELR